MPVTATATLVERRVFTARLPWWISTLGVATAGVVADAALKLWAVSQLAYLRETPTLFGIKLLLVFNRRPSFDYEHFMTGQAFLVMIKFLALGYLGWRLKGWWRWLGLGLILGGAIANVGNWLLTRAVPDFLVMPWATVNLADLLIVTGAAVICAGWGARGLTHLIGRTRPVMGESPRATRRRTSTARVVSPAGQSRPRFRGYRSHRRVHGAGRPWRPAPPGPVMGRASAR